MVERIAPVAKAALDLMLTRGCFDEEVEENQPSNRTFEAALLRLGADLDTQA
jgi:hypothetical protein